MMLGAPVRHLFMNGVVWKLDRKPCEVLEIGSYRGASALTWHEAGCSVMCIDAWEGYETAPVGLKTSYDKFLKNIEGTGVDHVRGDSQQLLVDMPENCRDIVYIDGDHRYAGVKADILNSMPLVKDGGIICGDDLNVQYNSGKVSAVLARQSLNEDFVRDWDGIKYHPGVTCAVWDVFGEVSMWGGFWAMQKVGRKWQKISLKGMPIVYPSHFTSEDIEDAKQHLQDIEI